MEPVATEVTPLVSITVTVYNHEHYIERCLRGLAMQEVDFPFEVIVGDDCSKDGTVEVCKRVAKELPENFTFIYREKNIFPHSSTDLVNRARGTYLATCEGDDFWTDPHKLQRQVDYLEAHPDCVAVFHGCEVVGADSLPNGEHYPQCDHPHYSFKDYFYSVLPGHVSTMVVRREPYLLAKRRFDEKRCYQWFPDDRRIAFLLLSLGQVYCMPDTMSAYRHVVSGTTSYSSTLKIDNAYAKNEVGFAQTLVRYAEEWGSDEALACARQCYYRLLLKWSVGKVAPFGLKDTLGDVFSQSDWPKLLWAPVRWYAVLGTRALRGKAVDL